MSYFRVPLFITALILIGLFVSTGNIVYVYDAIVLSAVEISLSFDNAVVDAALLENMSPGWRRIWMVVGWPVAVIGMRFFLPLLIVSLLGNVSIVQAFGLALHDHKQFASVLTGAHASVVGFGGAFLLMTALQYFMDGEKETHWLGFLESNLVKLGQFEVDVQAAVTLVVVLVLYSVTGSLAFLLSAVAGIVVFIGVNMLKAVLESIDARMAKAVGDVVKGGIGTLIYLEVLDASFSFDGVIAAFAISNDIFVVAAGLGIGALFVRTMVVMLVDAGTLTEFKYLENGAFWSILALSGFMFASLFEEIPDYVVAGASISLIGLSLVYSILEKKREVPVWPYPTIDDLDASKSDVDEPRCNCAKHKAPEAWLNA